MKLSGMIVLCLAVVLTGCSREPESQPVVPAPTAPTQPPAEKGTLQTVVGGLTGQIAVERGREARSKIQAIASNEQSALEETMR